jgi:hypothetical protein
MPIALRQCTACLRPHRALALRAPVRAASSSSKKWEEPEPRHIDEDADEFDDVLGELHRRRKKMDAKRNRTVSDILARCVFYVIPSSGDLVLRADNGATRRSRAVGRPRLIPSRPREMLMPGRRLR